MYRGRTKEYKNKSTQKSCLNEHMIGVMVKRQNQSPGWLLLELTRGESDEEYFHIMFNNLEIPLDEEAFFGISKKDLVKYRDTQI